MNLMRYTVVRERRHYDGWGDLGLLRNRLSPWTDVIAYQYVDDERLSIIIHGTNWRKWKFWLTSSCHRHKSFHSQKRNEDWATSRDFRGFELNWCYQEIKVETLSMRMLILQTLYLCTFITRTHRHTCHLRRSLHWIHRKDLSGTKLTSFADVKISLKTTKHWSYKKEKKDSCWFVFDSNGQELSRPFTQR